MTESHHWIGILIQLKFTENYNDGLWSEFALCKKAQSEAFPVGYLSLCVQCRTCSKLMWKKSPDHLFFFLKICEFPTRWTAWRNEVRFTRIRNGFIFILWSVDHSESINRWDTSLNNRHSDYNRICSPMCFRNLVKDPRTNGANVSSFVLWNSMKCNTIFWQRLEIEHKQIGSVVRKHDSFGRILCLIASKNEDYFTISVQSHTTIIFQSILRRMYSGVNPGGEGW